MQDVKLNQFIVDFAWYIGQRFIFMALFTHHSPADEFKPHILRPDSKSFVV